MTTSLRIMVGAKPSYDSLDVSLAFLKVGSSKSRASLTKELGLGEGAMRSILDVLKDKGLIISTQQGHTYTGLGEKLIQKLHTLVVGPLRVCTQFFSQSAQVAITLKGAGEIPWQARDTAIAHGAQAALVLTMKSDGLVAQGLNDDFSNLAQQVSAGFGDAVIVAVASDEIVATKAALASAVKSSSKLSDLLKF